MQGSAGQQQQRGRDPQRTQRVTTGQYQNAPRDAGGALNRQAAFQYVQHRPQSTPRIGPVGLAELKARNLSQSPTRQAQTSVGYYSGAQGNNNNNVRSGGGVRQVERYDLPARGQAGIYRPKLVQAYAITKRTDVQPGKSGVNVQNYAVWSNPQTARPSQTSSHLTPPHAPRPNQNAYNHAQRRLNPAYTNVPHTQLSRPPDQVRYQALQKPAVYSSQYVKPAAQRSAPQAPQYVYVHQRYPVEVKSHIFLAFKKPELLTWCDACNGLIWPMLGSTCAKCKHCSFTVHHRCLEAFNTVNQLPICPSRPVKLKPKSQKAGLHQRAVLNQTASQLAQHNPTPSLVTASVPTATARLGVQLPQRPHYASNNSAGSSSTSTSPPPPQQPLLTTSTTLPNQEVHQRLQAAAANDISRLKRETERDTRQQPNAPIPKLSWRDQAYVKNTSTIRKNFANPKELHDAINRYNNVHGDNNLKMSLHDDLTTFRGYIRVTVDLSRPVKIILQTSKSLQLSADSSQNHNNSSAAADQTAQHAFKKFDCFSKNLHLTSQTTAYDVIEALLKRYKVTDHIKKFALYQRIQKTATHHVVERLEYSSKPLVLRLVHGSNIPSHLHEKSSHDNHTFYMSETDVDGIQWDQFNQLELTSFLQIVDIEESNTKREICNVYNKFKESLMKARQEKT